MEEEKNIKQLVFKYAITGLLSSILILSCWLCYLCKIGTEKSAAQIKYINNFLKKGDSIRENTKYYKINPSYDFSSDSFNSVVDVYKKIKKGDRVIFVTRHSERGSDYSKQGGLTENGIVLAKILGVYLQGGVLSTTSTDFYGSTDFKRTVETSYYIGQARGNERLKKNLLSGDSWEEYTEIDHPIDVLADVYFNDDRSTLSSRYYELNKNYVDKKSKDLITTLCELTKGHNFSWFSSHDMTMMPLIIWSTNQQINFSGPGDVNFLQGIAVIVHQDGGWEVYPVDGSKF